MDSRSAIFLQVMIGIAVVGLVAFLIVLIGRTVRGPQGQAKQSGGVTIRARWPELLLAVVAAVAVTLIVVWQFPPIGGEAAAAKSWRAAPRATVFFVVMLITAGVALVAFLVYLFTRQQNPPDAAPSASAEVEAGAEEVAQHPTPSTARLVGLLLLALAILLLCWVYVPREQQYGLMLYMIYPASFAVALVMLFDKATRAWSIKPAAAAMREWLLCDLVAFLLVLGYLNLLASKAEAKYASVHWDLLHIAAFFLVFWLLDRKAGRLRFLAAYVYLIALPILLLIWQATQGVPAAKDAGFWGSIWPFFGLAIIFFVLEIIVLAARRATETSVLPTLKDGVFVVGYGVLLLIGQ